jgi:Universal stress protein family
LKAATEEGVRCNTVIELSDHPHGRNEGLRPDLMASHGRRGVQGLLLGSETQKVLTHTRIPVLVYR